jgi:hypothetical protein
VTTARSQHAGDDVFDARLKRREELRSCELHLQVARREKSLAYSAAKALREPRLILWNRALKPEFFLLRIEQHPDGYGV